MAPAAARHVFVTGGTGYLGRPLIEQLVARGHPVTALARLGAESNVPRGATVVTGNVLDAESWRHSLGKADTLVHLVGTPRPNPSKAREFRDVDLASIRAATQALAGTAVRHVVYVSVAHPAPVMRAYIEARSAGEALIRNSGVDATILRPWYVLGPGHRWPYLLIPLYAVLARVPATAGGTRRLGLVTREQMVAALVRAVENPPDGVRVVDVAGIRGGSH